MQGTIAVLMALSGLGCHHRDCAATYVPACYGSCYASACYASAMGCYGGLGCYAAPQFLGCYGGLGCYASAGIGGVGCYGSACYATACYGGLSSYGCYGGGHGHKRRGGLFGGLCHRRQAACCGIGYAPPNCYEMAMGCYGGAVFGAYTPVYGAPVVMGSPIYTSGQMATGQYGTSQYGASQYGASQYGASQYGASPYGASTAPTDAVNEPPMGDEAPPAPPSPPGPTDTGEVPADTEPATP